MAHAKHVIPSRNEPEHPIRSRLGYCTTFGMVHGLVAISMNHGHGATQLSRRTQDVKVGGAVKGLRAKGVGMNQNMAGTCISNFQSIGGAPRRERFSLRKPCEVV